LNRTRIGYLLLRERSYKIEWQRQIREFHDIELNTVVSNTSSREMFAGRAVILAALLLALLGGVTRGTYLLHHGPGRC
jgi:hypothetical protein